MNKKRVRFHESVKKEDGNSIKRLKNGHPLSELGASPRLRNLFNFSQMTNALNVIDRYAKLDEILNNIKNNTIKISNLSQEVLLNLKDYCTLDYDIRNYIIQELISRE